MWYMDSTADRNVLKGAVLLVYVILNARTKHMSALVLSPRHTLSDGSEVSERMLARYTSNDTMAMSYTSLASSVKFDS